MTKLLTVIAAVTLIIMSADPASAGWRRRCCCRGQFHGRTYVQPTNGQSTYMMNNQGNYSGYAGQSPTQSVTAGYPPTDANGSVQNNPNVQAPAPPPQAPAPATTAPDPATRAPVPATEAPSKAAPQPNP